MKKTLLFVCLSLFCYLAGAQTIVSTKVKKKSVLLEEYTGISCGYCPEGHAIGHNMKEMYGDKVSILAIHAGYYSSPVNGDDFRTPFGEPFVTEFGVSGYPAGAVNRTIFPGNSNVAMSRSLWLPSAQTVMKEEAPVNIGVSSSYDPATREVTVDVELYYHELMDGYEEHTINLAVTQDSVWGYQVGTPNPNNYCHMHMLRDMITGQWGDPVGDATRNFISRSYTYTLPETVGSEPIVVENCDIVAFLSDGKNPVYAAATVYINGGTNKEVVSMNCPLPMSSAAINEEYCFDIDVTSNLEGSNDFTMEVMPMSENNWEYSFNALDTREGMVVTLEKDVPKTIQVCVTPTDLAFNKFKLVVSSLDEPAAPAQEMRVGLMAEGASVLLVNAIGDEKPMENVQCYRDALSQPDMPPYVELMADEALELFAAAALDDIEGIYYNVAWSFPALTDEQCAAFAYFLDNDGYLFISGQDIGWDIMSGHDQANGTPQSQAFYTDYLKAEYKDDGSPSNSKINPYDSEDPYFGSLAEMQVEAVFGAEYVYPDVLDALEGAKLAMMYNNTPSKGAAVVYSGEDYKTVYLGVGLEMIKDQDKKNAVIKSTQMFFDGVVGVDEYIQMLESNIMITPNPAKSIVNITGLSTESEQELRLYNVNGQLVKLYNCTPVKGETTIDVSGLENGIYTLIEQSGNTTKLVVE